MIERANAGVPVGQLARIGLHIADELGECLRRHRRMHRQRERGNRDVGNRLQVLERIVERPALEDRLGDVGRRAAEQDGVAVRPRARDGGGTERAAAAALVLDHDGAEQRLDFLGPRPADGIITAAGRERDHQPDRTIGIFCLRDCRARRQCARRHRGQAKFQHITSPHLRSCLYCFELDRVGTVDWR